MIGAGWLLAAALAVVAFLYASVGHAGASGYIAVLALAGLPAEQIKPLALKRSAIFQSAHPSVISELSLRNNRFNLSTIFASP